MQLEWYGQSAFRLTDGERTVFVDPFGDMGTLHARRLRWDYPAISGVAADLLLVTHEHRDHNGVAAIGGEPVVLRSTAGRLESPIGEVLAVASEHDDAAGTVRGPNTIFAFTLGGLRVAHMGDFGQAALRPEQARALGAVDVLIAPVGGGPTIDAEQTMEAARILGARVLVPMHYRTERIDFLEPLDALLALARRVERAPGTTVELTAGPHAGGGPLVVVPAAP